MKKKRFYNNKKRNQKWTEEQVGRKIDFADKYIEAGTGSDKFDKKRPKPKRKRFSGENARKLAKNLIVAVCCFAIISVGYTAMDLYMDRNAMPDEETDNDGKQSIGTMALDIKGVTVQSLSLDGGIMLDAVIDDAHSLGYSSVTIDLKRDDGTIGYESKLATIGAYGAISSASSRLEESVTMLLESDILPVARISCYKDNIAPVADLTLAVKNDSSLYKDNYGNTYLNPDVKSTYNYIKSIIEEAKGMGINVFILDNYDLPERISNDYNDGFQALSRQLYTDFGDEIKVLMTVDVNIATEQDDKSSEYNNKTKYDEDALKEEIGEKITQNAGTNSIYYISTDLPDEVKEILDQNNISSYIIATRNGT